MKRKKAHKDYLEGWIAAMRFGLIDGRPFSEISVQTYSSYATWFLDQYGTVSIDTVKTMLLTIPIQQFAKRYKMYTAIRSFAKYLVQEKVMNDTFLQEVIRYRPRRHLPPKKLTVNQSSLEKLMYACRSPEDRLIVVLLSHTGLRASEAVGLLLNDINLEQQFLVVRTAKWGKSRRVGLTSQVVSAISEYLAVRPDVKSNYLFINALGDQMDRFGLKTRLRKLGQRAGVQVTPHALRRAFVTINANKGRSLVMLQIACGHNDISTTRSYCMTSEDETIEAMKGWE